MNKLNENTDTVARRVGIRDTSFCGCLYVRTKKANVIATNAYSNR